MKLLRLIREAVEADRFLVSAHADERCEEREIESWQLVTGVADAKLVAEHPSQKPNPTVNVRQQLADGTEVEVVWAWLKPSGRAKLVTVYFPD
jgi:hypothetical protein